MLPLETKVSGGKLLPQSDLGWGGVSGGNVMQALRQEEDQQSRNNYGYLACCEFSQMKTIFNCDIRMVTKHEEYILITYKFIQ